MTGLENIETIGAGLNDAGHGIGIADSASLVVRDKRALFADIPEKRASIRKHNQRLDFPSKLFMLPGTKKAGDGFANRLFDIWLPIVDAYRTFCIAPSREIRAVFENIAKLQIS